VKTLTREQLQSRKEKAVRFVRDVLGDPDRAAEIEEEDLEEYAAHRKVQIINPAKKGKNMATNNQLRQRIRELEEENTELNDQLEAIQDIVSPSDDDTDDDEEEGDDGDDFPN
jgi:hypothetical protein